MRDPNGVFSIISHQGYGSCSHMSFIDDVMSVISLYYFIDVFLSI